MEKRRAVDDAQQSGPWPSRLLSALEKGPALSAVLRCQSRMARELPWQTLDDLTDNNSLEYSITT
jgi:hypothetical protein